MTQRQLNGMLCDVPRPELLPEEDIALCKTFRDAMGLCIQRSRVRRAMRDLAAEASIHPPRGKGPELDFRPGTNQRA